MRFMGKFYSLAVHSEVCNSFFISFGLADDKMLLGRKRLSQTLSSNHEMCHTFFLSLSAILVSQHTKWNTNLPINFYSQSFCQIAFIILPSVFLPSSIYHRMHKMMSVSNTTLYVNKQDCIII